MIKTDNDNIKKTIEGMKRKVEKLKHKNDVSIEELFKAECKKVDFVHEYGRTFEGVRYGIYSLLSEDEMREKYEEQLSRFCPYVVLKLEVGVAYLISQRNDEKHERRIRMGEYFDPFSDAFQSQHTELLVDSVAEDYLRREEAHELIKIINKLSNIQRKRVTMYCVEGYSIAEIADIENVSVSAISQSISRAIKKIMEHLDETQS